MRVMNGKSTKTPAAGPGVVSLWRELFGGSAAVLETHEEEEQVIDINATVLGTGAGTVVEVGRCGSSLELDEEVEQVVDVDAAVGGAGAVATVEVGEATGVLNTECAGNGKDAPAAR